MRPSKVLLTRQDPFPRSRAPHAGRDDLRRRLADLGTAGAAPVLRPSLDHPFIPAVRLSEMGSWVPHGSYSRVDRLPGGRLLREVIWHVDRSAAILVRMTGQPSWPRTGRAPGCYSHPGLFKPGSSSSLVLATLAARGSHILILNY